MKNGEDIDKLFRRGLADPVNETGFREDDWDALEQLLDGGKKRRGIVYWLPVISSVAAMLLLILGWWLLKPQATDNDKPKQQIAGIEHPKQMRQPAVAGNSDEGNNAGTTQNTAKPSNENNSVTPQNSGDVNNTAAQIAATKATPNIPGVNYNYANNLVRKGPAGITKNQPADIGKSGTNAGVPNLSPDHQPANINIVPADLVAVNSGINIDAKMTGRQYGNGIDPTYRELPNNAYVKTLAEKRNKIITTSSFKHPQFALTIMGAPEINGVNSFQTTKTGTSAGLLLSIGINKLTISTGVAYSKKPYNTSFENYHSSSYTFKTYPINVIADCRAIDIPLNIDYQVFNKHQNKISVGTGISSYLMMHESYQYDYADPAKPSRNYNVASPGKYLFGVLNLQATYQRQLNSKFGVTVQPYLKLPLTNIGSSEVKLQSAGVALGVSWNINSLTKP